MRFPAFVFCLVIHGTLLGAEKLNVVFILADDLGWSDTTLFGTTELYQTPHIERLADRGMLLTRAHASSPLCSPTRASVLTGLSPARHGITAPNCHLPFDHDPDIPDHHIEDRMASEAAAFMQTHSDQPFFLNYWMFSVHAPFDAKSELIEKYRGRIDPDDPQRSPTYAAMIESMDDAIGTLLDTIDRLGIAENTIIVFASDNGGNMYNEVDGTTPTSNAPLRGGKATMYEGGVRGPAIFVHPGRIAAGSTSNEIIQSVDFYLTLLDLLSIEPLPDQTSDGLSLKPAMQAGTLDREGIFTYFLHAPGVPDRLPPSVSVHRGDWKLIRVFHDLVDRLDGLIENHFVETNAVRPRRNQNFDASIKP